MIPIPQMAEALIRGRHDIVRNSLEAHIRALTLSLSRSFRDEDVEWSRRVEENAQRLAVVLETICQHAGRASFQSNQRLVELITRQTDGLTRFLQGLDGRPVVSKHKKALEEMITFHVSQLQSLSKSPGKSSPNLAKKSAPSHMSQMQKVHWDRWSTLEDKEVIRESALDGTVLNMAQDFLISDRCWTRDALEKEIRAWLLPVVEAELCLKNLNRAKDILHNMGCDMWEEIKSICVETTESSLRNYLVCELNDLQMLSSEEKDASEYINLVQRAATNRAIQSDKELGTSEEFPSPESLSISFILQQSALHHWKSFYVTHLYFHTGDGTLEPMIDKDTSWRYLLSNKHVDLLKCWIEFSFHPECPEWFGYDGPHFANRIGRLLKNWPITQDMIDQVDILCSDVPTKDAVLDALCRYGKTSTSEKTNIRTILLRLSRSRRLSSFGPGMNLDIPWFSIQKLLFEFCVKHNLPDLAVIWRLDPQPEYTAGWPMLYNSHCQLAKTPENLPLAAECLQRCIEYLAEKKTSRIDDSDQNSLLVVANLLLNSQSLSCIFAEESPKTTGLSTSQLKRAAAQFPLLGCAVKQTIWPTAPDVKLYDLLQDCTTCNINRIFQWRFGLKKGFIEDDNPWSEYPHFSSDRLISKFGYNDSLTLSYYLREGRPSFAACIVLVEGFLASGKISNKALKDVCTLAHGLALQHFSDSRITASCVAFTEMLGRSSMTIRTQIAVANFIYAHETARTGDAEQSYSRVSMILKDLSLGHQERSGREMLLILGRILEQKMYALEENNFDCFINNKGSLLHEQGLEARFAAIHRLPHPERFMRQCARKGHWLIALLFCQIHSYPHSLVFQIIGEIPDPRIRQHLRCLFARNVINVEFPKLSASRACFYSRFGVRQEPPMSENVLSRMSWDSSESELSEVPFGEDAVTTFADCCDLVEILVRCHSESKPSAVLLYNAIYLPNPTLALVAVCYERDWEFKGLCSWLAAWLPSTQRALFLRKVESRQNWTAKSAERVLTETLKTGLVVTMQRGFAVFLPDNPLKILADVLVDCIENRIFDKTTERLQRFFEASHDYKLKIRGSEHFVFEHSWLASAAIKLCTTALVYCLPSARHQYLFLKALSDAGIGNQLNDCNDNSGSVAKFAQLARIVECLMPTDVYLNIGRWLHNSQEENKRCLDLLLQSEWYEEAIELTKITNLPADAALTTQLAAKLQQCLSEAFPDLKQFWKDCETKLRGAGMSSETASKFYRECASRLSSSLDRFTALRLALRWLRWNSKEGDVLTSEWQLHLISAAEVENMEKEMWTQCIQAGEAAVKELKKITTPTPLIHLSSTTLNARRATLWQIDQEEPQSLRGQTEDRVDELIGNLLDMGDIAAACRVETLFGVHNKDLTILLACLTIAEEKMKVPECLASLLPDVLSTSPSSPHFKYSYPRQSSSLSKQDAEDDHDVNQAVHSEYVEIPSREKQEALAAIQGLCERLTHGRRIGAQFAACYRLAMNLDFKFQDVLRVGEPLKLLRTALTEACWDQIVVAADLLETFQLAPNQVAEFLAREIVSAISKGAAQGCARNCTLWGGKMEKIFLRVLNLAPDTALLAKELLNIARRQTVSSPDAPREVLDTVTELLIRAHYCYTSACNMEGIASVLRDAQRLTTALTDRQEWRMMVRLLTGIQRFTEMSYVFRILKDNKQFECLLRKDIDKVHKGKTSKRFQEYPEDDLEYLLRKDSAKPVGLKVALLEWLRRECPEEKSLHKMTALHFGMYRELAGLWKGEAETRCRLAVASKMINNQATQNLLTTVMQDYSHAAEYYLQANMLTHAVHCAHQAELCALQQHFIVTAPPDQAGRQVLLLDSKAVTQLITNILSLPQAKIVIRAYNHNTDWGSALFQHCVATSSEAEAYLAAWTSSYELTPSLLQDVALRFQRSPVITREMGRNMRRVLNYMQDIEVRYRVASQLGFKDVVEGMLRGVEVAYLKDTVWQSGFRN